MSWPPIFTDSNDAPWLPSPIDSSSVPGCVNIDDITTSFELPAPSRPHDSLKARAIVAPVDTEDEPDEAGPKRLRKRARYAYLKCTFCRRDKQKCNPGGRQWPGQKCHRCVLKGFACSDGKTTKCETTNRQRVRLKPILRASPAKLPALGANPLLEECLVTISWYRMITHMASVATEIDSAIRQKARKWGSKMNPPELLSDISRGVHDVSNIIARQIRRLCVQNPSLEHDVIAEVFRAAMQKLPDGGLHRSIEKLHSAFSNGKKAEDNDASEFTTLTCSIHATFSAELLSSTNEDQIISAAKTYIDGLESTWDSISRLYEHDVVTHRLPTLTTPFIHEFYFTDSTPRDRPFLWALFNADTKRRLRRDSLGRSGLHFATEKWDFWEWSDIFEIMDTFVDDRDVFGRTPLHIACAPNYAFGVQSQRYVIKRLLASFANIFIRDAYGLLAIDYAIQDNRADILEIFRKQTGLDIDNILSAMAGAEEAEKKVQVAGIQACDRLLEKISSEGEE
ncbi:hypothetical protein HD806DRAFT_23683 [Xylariaceae sp. AK1471]|nr:hypothetical protein HD806DRAFT_23683 [Xylariaceae sp. AK1471]